MIEFEEGVSTTENWLRQAWQLFEASKVLYQSMDGVEVPRTESETHREVGAMKGVMLLMGLAVENALKGAFVHEFPPDTSGGRLKSTHFRPSMDFTLVEKLIENLQIHAGYNDKNGWPIPR